jgi:FKBP-type peptidyl-prolyl cis-trans isomerases 1
MKKISILLLAVTIVFASCGKKKVVNVKLSSEKDSIAFFIGALTANNLKSNLKDAQFENFNKEVYLKVVEEILSGDSVKFNDMYMSQKLNMYFQKLQQQQGEKYLAEGKAFLEKNKTNPGIVTLPSGLQYQVIKEGNGPKPDSSDVVSFNYRGTLINGDEFDASKGEPAKVNVRGVIPGMTEAFLKMNVGSKWKIFIPSNLGYGERVRPGGKLKPNSVLIFDVELMGIEPKAPKADVKPVAPAKRKK